MFEPPKLPFLTALKTSAATPEAGPACTKELPLPFSYCLFVTDLRSDLALQLPPLAAS